MIGRLAQGDEQAASAAQLMPACFRRRHTYGAGRLAVGGERRPVFEPAEQQAFPGIVRVDYGRPLRDVDGMVGLVLLIALANRGML